MDSNQVSGAIALVSAIIPEAGIVIAGIRAAFGAANPGKTEDDFINELAGSAAALTFAADAQLVADGYVRQPDGTWLAPTSGLG
jgi:hypothetical protein